MKTYEMTRLRNLALVGHGGAGKTSLTESLLYKAKVISRLGKVEEGTTVSDHDPEEAKRSISISASIAPLTWKDHKINVIDTPGYFDFAGEVISSLSIADGALLMTCAVSGLEVGTEKGWRFAEEQGLPRMVFINKMDRENANFQKVLDELVNAFGSSVIPLQLPIGQAESFKGIIDLVEMKAYTYDKGESQMGEIPADLADEVEALREKLVEAVAVVDDSIIEKYLNGEEINTSEIQACLKVGVQEGLIVPVLCGSATKLVGVDLLMDQIISGIPSPADHSGVEGTNPKTGNQVKQPPAVDGPLVAQVFKTMADPYVGKLTLFRVYSGLMRSDTFIYNASKGEEERVGQLFLIRGKEQEPVDSIQAGDIGAVAKLQGTTTGDTLCTKDSPLILDPIKFPEPSLSLAVVAAGKGDEDKIGSGLARLTEEDPTFKVQKSAETGDLLASGMGELQLEIMMARLKKKFGADVKLIDPRIPYRETIRATVKVEGKHKKQTGGRGQFGHVWLELSPKGTGEGFEFVDKIFGGAVPKQYIPAVEKGVRETLVDGVLAGYPVVDVQVTLTDGSFHPVDSSEMAFKIAASMAFKKAFMEAKPVLLEPIMNVEVTVPEEYMGDIIGDLNKKRGRILGMDPSEKNQIVKAQAPLAEMFRYAIDLRSLTQGRGSFRMEFDHYEEVPSTEAAAIIETAATKKE